MTQPKVTVIVPFYNSKRYIRECVESLSNQTLAELEIICVDDGSTDDSPDIVRECAKKDDRIKLISKPNKGYGHSMNLGMSLATGEYMGILESDDYAPSGMFERLYDIAKSNNLDFIKADFSRFYRINGIETEETVRICGLRPSLYNKILNPSVDPELLDVVMNTWAGIYKIDFLKKFDIKHNETPGASYQDNGFWFQTFCLGTKIMFLNEIYYHLRRDNPDSSVRNTGKVYCVSEEYEFILDFLKRNPDLYKRFIYMFHKKKYQSYLFTTDRIDDAYRMEFLEYIREEFLEALSSGELAKEVFSAYDWRNLTKLLKSAEDFYNWRHGPYNLINWIKTIRKEFLKKYNL